MKFNEALKGYWLEKRKLFSIRTIENYERMFSRFAKYINDKEVADITSDDIRRFLDYLLTQNLSRRTVHDYWVPLSGFWTWAENELEVKHIIRNRVAAPTYTETEVDPFSEDEVKRFLVATEHGKPWQTKAGNTVRSKRPTMLRDKAIILTLVDCGIRATELCQLVIGDYDTERGRLRVKLGKGNKERFLYLGDRARKAIWRYMATRTGAKAKEPLFQTRTGEHLDRNELGNLIYRLADLAEIQGAHTHRFRHTFAIEFLRNGGSTFELQKILGHKNLKTVLIYAKLAEVDIEKAGRNSSPADSWKLR